MYLHHRKALLVWTRLLGTWRSLLLLVSRCEGTGQSGSGSVLVSGGAGARRAGLCKETA